MKFAEENETETNLIRADWIWLRLLDQRTLCLLHLLPNIPRWVGVLGPARLALPLAHPFRDTDRALVPITSKEASRRPKLQFKDKVEFKKGYVQLQHEKDDFMQCKIVLTFLWHVPSMS